MRVRPIMPAGAGRVVHQPVEIGGYVIPAGSKPITGMYHLQEGPTSTRSPRHFSRTGFSGSASIPYEWVPFGGGVRRCLGMAFALFEMKVVVATVLMQAHLRIECRDRAVHAAGSFLRRRWAAGRRRRLTARPSSGRDERLGLMWFLLGRPRRHETPHVLDKGAGIGFEIGHRAAAAKR